MDGSMVFTKWRQSAPHLIGYMLLWVYNQNSISIGSAILAQLTAECCQLPANKLRRK